MSTLERACARAWESSANLLGVLTSGWSGLPAQQVALTSGGSGPPAEEIDCDEMTGGG